MSSEEKGAVGIYDTGEKNYGEDNNSEISGSDRENDSRKNNNLMNGNNFGSNNNLNINQQFGGEIIILIDSLHLLNLTNLINK